MKKSLGAKTIILPLPVLIIGTYDSNDKPNVMAAAWGGICCSKPPAVGVSLRKATYSYSSIVERQAFTVNIPPEKYVREADYFGTASGRNEDKFAQTGLTPVRGEYVDAPYIEEFPMVLECKVIHTVEIGLHTQFIGEIMDLKVDEDFFDEREEVLFVNKIKPLTYSNSDRTYYGLGKPLGKAWSIGKEFMAKK